MAPISVHVFKGAKLMDIYGENDILSTHYNIESVDKDMARERNKEIELEVTGLREMLNFNGTKLKPERVEAIYEEIEHLLKERDDNTFKFGLAGEKFNRIYKEQEKKRVEKIIRDDFSEFTDDEILNSKLLVREQLDNQLVGADRDGDFLSDESRFRFITEEMVTLYSKKNTDYGDAFAQSLDEDGLLVSKIRIKDKLNRFSQLINNDALVDDETMRDTLIDLANYTVMTLMWLDENE